MNIIRLATIAIILMSSPALTEPILRHAINDACNLGYPAGAIVSGLQHPDDEEGNSSHILEAAEGWREGIEKFSESESSRLLLSYISILKNISPELTKTSKPQVCAVAKPIYAISLTAAELQQAGANFTGVEAIVSASRDMKFIEELCDFTPFSIPLSPACN